MGNRPQSEEHILFELAAIRQAVWRHAWSDDVLDAHERRNVCRIDSLIDFVAEVKARRQLAALIEKGGEPSEYMNRLAEPCRMRVIRLDDEREKRKVADIRDYRNGNAG